VLLLGSVQKDDATPFSDIDVVVVIKNFNLEGIRQMREFLRHSNKLVDLSFICWDEIPKDPNLFAFGTHGCYQLGLVLNKAKCLYGFNILAKLGTPSKDNIKYSLTQKAIQYAWWARRIFVESNRERSIESNYQINSRLVKMIRGLLYILEEFDLQSTAEDAINRFLQEYRHLLSEEEISIVAGLTDKSLMNSNSANMSESYLELRVSIINKIHAEVMKLVYSL